MAEPGLHDHHHGPKDPGADARRAAEAQREVERARRMRDLQSLDEQQFPNRLAFLDHAIALLRFVVFQSLPDAKQHAWARQAVTNQIEADDAAVAEIEPADGASPTDRRAQLAARNAAHRSNVAREHEQTNLVALEQRDAVASSALAAPGHQTTRQHGQHERAARATGHALDRAGRGMMLEDPRLPDVPTAERELRALMLQAGIDPNGWAARVFFAYAGAPYASAHGTAASPSRLLALIIQNPQLGSVRGIDRAAAVKASANASSSDGGARLEQLEASGQIQFPAGGAFQLSAPIPPAAQAVIRQIVHGDADMAHVAEHINTLPAPWPAVLSSWRSQGAIDWLQMPAVEQHQLVCDQLGFEAQRARGVGMPNGLSQGAAWFRAHTASGGAPEPGQVGALHLVDGTSELAPGTALFHVVFTATRPTDATHHVPAKLLTADERSRLGLAIDPGTGELVRRTPGDPAHPEFVMFRHEATVVIMTGRRAITLETTDSRNGGGDGAVPAEGTGMAMRPLDSPPASEQAAHPGRDGLSPSSRGFWLAGYIPEQPH